MNDIELESTEVSKVYAMLIVCVNAEKTILHPIRAGDAIVNAVALLSEKYPGCRIRVLEDNTDRRYFTNLDNMWHRW